MRETGRSSLTVGVLFMAVAAGLGTSNAVLSITKTFTIGTTRR